jgi:ribosomal protein L35
MKLKTRKSAAKRVNIKKFVIGRKKAYKSHLLRKKNSKRLRTLSSCTQLHKSDRSVFYSMNPYS